MYRTAGKILFLTLNILVYGFGQIPTQASLWPKSLIKTLQKADIHNLDDIIALKLPDSTSSFNPISGNFFRFENNPSAEFRYLYIGRVYSCRSGGCSMKNETISHESSEYFDYYILFDENKTVRRVGVYNYMATHGQEITAKGWLKQFAGYDGFAPLQVDKDIDAISGATISVYAITADIEHKSRLLQITTFAEPVLNGKAVQ